MKLIYLCIAVTLFSCKKNNTQSNSAYQIGLNEYTIQINQQERNYIVYQPSTNNIEGIIIILHGGGGNGATGLSSKYSPASVFHTIADQNNLLIVYPNGNDDLTNTPSWNDCRADNTLGRNTDDIAFLNQLIDELFHQTGFKQDKVFLVGISNGALMSFRFAFEYPQRIAALATMIGNLPATPQSGACSLPQNVAIPIFLSFGLEDRVMPIDGGCVGGNITNCNRGTVLSMDETINFWLEKNQLQQVSPDINEININYNDGGTVEKYTYQGSDPIVVMKMNGAGHQIPSKTIYFSTNLITGTQNRDIEFAEEVWSFFSNL